MAVIRSRSGRKWMIPLIIGLLSVGGVCFGYYNIFKEYRRAAASSGWPTAAGTITRSVLRMRDSSKGGRDTWTLEAAYKYEVDGKPYEGSVLRFGGFPSTSDREEALASREKYGLGTTHPVHYEPGNPERAVLEPGAGAAASSLALGAVLLTLGLLLGLVPLWGGIRGLMEQKQTAAVRG